MNTSFWAPYISDGTIKAVCWTLIHSLWIGMIIALVAGPVITFTRKSTANIRYRLLCGVLALFVLAVIVTYSIEITSANKLELRIKAANIIANPVNIIAVGHAQPVQQLSLFGSAMAFLNQNTSVIFLVWLLFFVLKGLKMVSGLLYIQRIRHYKIHVISEELEHKVELFSRQIGIRQTVSLLQSELVKIPVAVGWLKPVILLPMGIVLQISTEQLECVLWHELAHIRRRDYLVNILQGLVETVFFFNPALLWLSSLIRAEREACCDDLVLSQMDRKANYLETLLSFAYGGFKPAGLAMGIGSGNQLRDRLKRLISQENKRLSVAEKAVLAIVFILLTAFTTLPKVNDAARPLVHNINKKAVIITPVKPVAVAPGIIKATFLPKVHQLAARAVIERADTLVHFISVIFKNSDADLAYNDIKAMDDKGNKYHFFVVNNQLTAMEINDVKIADDKLAGYQYMIRYIDREVINKRQVMAADIAGYKAKAPVAKFKDGSPEKFNKQKYIDDQNASPIASKQYNDQRYTNGEPQASAMKVQAMRKRMQDDSSNFAVQLQRARGVIADLVKEKVVPDAASVKWFGLSDTELIVNGQKQPGALQQKLMGKYGVYKNYGLYYGPVQMTGTGVFIDDSAKPPRPSRPEKLKPKYMGSVKPTSPDSLAWKNRQLIRQQQLFAAD